MQGHPSISDKQTALRLAYAPTSSGEVTTADFRAAFAAATAAVDPRSNPSVDTATYVVKPGDTLVGIARSRLTALGQPAGPAASMRYALQLAQANDVRDPNRIHAGQRLHLADIGTTATPPFVNAGIAGLPASSRTSVAMARAPQEPAWETRIVEDPPVDDLDAIDFDVTETLAPASPTAGTQTETTNPTSASEAAIVPAAREGVSLYKQVSAAPPEPKSDLPDILYKGIVGKVLDALPLDASTRTGLQQANAVIGTSIAARSLAALTGIGGPVLTLAGLIWGLFSAQKIEDMQAAESPSTDTAASPNRSTAMASASTRSDIE